MENERLEKTAGIANKDKNTLTYDQSSKSFIDIDDILESNLKISNKINNLIIIHLARIIKPNPLLLRNNSRLAPCQPPLPKGNGLQANTLQLSICIIICVNTSEAGRNAIFSQPRFSHYSINGDTVPSDYNVRDYLVDPKSLSTLHQYVGSAAKVGRS